MLFLPIPSNHRVWSRFNFQLRLAHFLDFGYRAVHLTANASKAAVRRYYNRAPEYSYFEGCSTGGRQGLMEAQRYPADFDGIVAEAPVYDYQTLNAGHVWMAQQVFKDNFAANLAFDTDGDGIPESLTKSEILSDTVIDQCDALDGISDGLLADPLSCNFDPDRDLAEWMCPAGVDADDCITRPQLQTIKDFYRGPVDSNGVQITEGLALGSEYGWSRNVYAHEGNNMTPFRLIYGLDHVNESSPFLVETLHGSRLVTQPSSSISSTSSPQSSTPA